MSDFDTFWTTACTQLTDFDEEQARWLWRRAQEAQEQRISELESALRGMLETFYGMDRQKGEALATVHRVAEEALEPPR